MMAGAELGEHPSLVEVHQPAQHVSSVGVFRAEPLRALSKCLWPAIAYRPKRA